MFKSKFFISTYKGGQSGVDLTKVTYWRFEQLSDTCRLLLTTTSQLEIIYGADAENARMALLNLEASDATSQAQS